MTRGEQIEKVLRDALDHLEEMDRAGADPWEWPRDLWVQEFPR